MKNPFERYRHAVQATDANNGNETLETRTEIQEAMMDALEEHVSGKQQFPPEMATALRIVFRDILDERTEHTRKKPGQDMQKHLGYSDCVLDARLYFRAAQVGLVRDKEPVKTIVQVFYRRNLVNGRVSKKTTMKWLKDPAFKIVTTNG
ncbi:MAG: hypothetical protein CFH06_00424 [Alphaproteobacteria bacterium MarineAlpha3_Bin5]|nr:MAG: hypothetical protein CFH06_00424 [Alphaproteobacteria bacterium MarineAlpha3_Bin5]|tara:strand:+ start:662 stop:1108 length:447 start_codon:yes stop_codon:yes gene_type:complete